MTTGIKNSRFFVHYFYDYFKSLKPTKLNLKNKVSKEFKISYFDNFLMLSSILVVFSMGSTQFLNLS